MPWGHHWQAMYDAHWDGPTVDQRFADVQSGATVEERRLVGSPNGEPVTVRWRGGAQHRRFVRCEFGLSVVPESFVTKCHFDRCRFRGSTWEGVRFSECTFERCDFSEMAFRRCYFVNTCRFERITASPQKFRIEDTAISASAFIAGLKPNLEYETPGLIPSSKSKFVATRQKIAKAIFSATRNEPEVDYYFEAYEQLTRCTLDERIERYRYDEATRERTFRPKFWLVSVPARVDKCVVLLSGWVTNWGKSIFLPMVAFASLVGLFAILYWRVGLGGGGSPFHQALKSLAIAANITLVVGYGTEFRHELSTVVKAVMIANVVSGLFWYSLVIPAIARRTLR